LPKGEASPTDDSVVPRTLALAYDIPPAGTRFRSSSQRQAIGYDEVTKREAKIGEAVGETVSITRDVPSLRQHVVGKKISFVQICGINSLKTLYPTPDDLAGSRVVDLVVDESRRHLVLVTDGHRVMADLARTGTAVPLVKADPWTVAGGGSMPTARIVFEDGTGLDFREPAKTKRITFTIGQG
jgi:hypothetical protein